MKKKSIITLSVIIAIVALIVAANYWRSHSMVRGLRVNIDYQGADTLISDTTVSEMVFEALPALRSTMVRDVDLPGVARAVARSPYLRDCAASTAVGGHVVVYAVQRRPIVRVCVRGEEYYLDDQCRHVPVSDRGSCNVIVASGNIPAKGHALKQVWLLARYLDSHPDVAPLFDQIYVDVHGDLYLTPKLGNHVVQVGNAANLDDKFHNLLALYAHALPMAGWDTYRQISVKFSDQIVCTRRQ